MAAFPGEFEDGGDEEYSHPLPPEDRLWRHPSELGSGELSIRLDPVVVRNRWLSSQPSRASAWTAGLVGALLATGLVVLGTHLATALTGQPSPSTPVTLSSIADPPPSPNTESPHAVGLSQSVVASIEHVGATVVTVAPAIGGVQGRALGVIISQAGYVLTSAASLQGATSVLVTLPGNVVVPAVSVARDPNSGLAVLQVNAPVALPAASLSTKPIDTSGFALAITAAGGERYELGNVQATDISPHIGANVLIDALKTDFLPIDSPLGSPILSSGGDVVGIVVGSTPSGAVVVPSWLALAVSQQLMMSGSVSHGWIGIKGVTDGHQSGVSVTDVAAASASAEAGILVGDVITSLDGEQVSSMPELQGRLYATRPGETVTLTLERGGRRLVRQLRLDDQVGG